MRDQEVQARRTGAIPTLQVDALQETELLPEEKFGCQVLAVRSWTHYMDALHGRTGWWSF
jgi:hypothetical protein